jgi:formiminotetrahydrofolate cyclodeaminase
MLSLAILILLGAVVNQNKKIADLEMKFDVYKDATENTENNIKANIKQIQNTTYGRTKELDDMYQNLNSRMNKHIIEHTMKGRI